MYDLSINRLKDKPKKQKNSEKISKRPQTVFDKSQNMSSKLVDNRICAESPKRVSSKPNISK